MNVEYSAGFAIGVAVAVVAAVLLLRLFHDDGKLRTQYDERQLAARGRAFSLAWWVLVALVALIVVLTVVEANPLDPMIELIFALFISISMQVSCSIMSDAYFGLNETNRSRIFIGFGAFSAFELFMGVSQLMKDGGLALPSALYLSAFVMFLVIFVSLGYKKFVDACEED